MGEEESGFLSAEVISPEALQGGLPLGVRSRPVPPEEAGARAARAHFASLDGGLLRTERDLLAAVAVSTAQGGNSDADAVVAAARIRLERMNLVLTFTEARRSEVLRHAAYVLGGAGSDVPSVSARISELWRKREGELAAEQLKANQLFEQVRTLLPPGRELLAHQRDALRMIAERGWRALVHDDQGLGKTVEILASLLLRSLERPVFPLLIVSTASTTGMWEAHVRDWLAALSPSIVRLSAWPVTGEGPEEELPDAGSRLVLVGSYARLSERCAGVRRVRWETVVFDEAHYLAGPDSARSRSAILCRGAARNVICATGTMQPNGRPVECLVPFRLLDPTNKDLEPRSYRKKWCGGRLVTRGSRKYYDDRGSTSPISFARLVDRYSFRRTKSELGSALPDKIRYKIPVELSEEDRLEIARLRDEVGRRIRERVADLGDPLSLPEGKKRDALVAKIGLVEGSSAILEVGKLRVLTGLAKVPSVVERCAELVEDGHRVVVFSYFGEVHQALVAALGRQHGRKFLHGDASLSSQRRTRLVDEANARASVLALTSAYSEGITLTAFDVVDTVDRLWVPDKERQQEDRLHRIGQKRTVLCGYYCAAGTPDDAMEELHWIKEGRSGRSVGSGYRRIYRWLGGEEERPEGMDP